MAKVEASTSSFLAIMVAFSIGVVLMGVADLHKRSKRLPVPPRAVGEQLVRELQGQVDIDKQMAVRAERRQLASQQREQDWEAVQRFVTTLVP